MAPQESVSRYKRAFEEGIATIEGNGSDSMSAAIDFWMRWPHWLSAIRAEDHDVNWACYLRCELARVHRAAEHRLVAAAESKGVDSTPIYEAARYARELLVTDFVIFGVGAAYHSWPDFLGQRRYELPDALQHAITNGEAAIRKTITLFDIEADPKANGGLKKLLPIVNKDDSITWRETTYANLHPDAAELFRLLIEHYPFPVEVCRHLPEVVISRVRESLTKTAKPLAGLLKSNRGKGTVLEI